MYFTLPLSVFLLILRVPIVRLFLGTGRFDWQDTLLTASSLGLFALSISAQSLVHLLARAFYAMHNTKIPVVSSLFSVFLNVSAAIFLINTSLGISGLALAASLANIVNALLLFLFLEQKIKLINRSLFIVPLIKIVFTSVVMGAAIYIPVKLLDQVFLDTRYTLNLIVLMILVSSFGAIVFLGLSYILEIKELKIFINLLKKARELPRIFFKSDVVEDVFSE